MIQQRYDRAFDPPAPVVGVLVHHPTGNGVSVSIDAQLDSGADRSVIPAWVAQRLGLELIGQLSFGVVGETVVLSIYEAGLNTPTLMEFVLEVAASESEEAVLLGRDVLNALHAHLDGPGRMLTLSAQPLLPPTP